MHADIWEMRGSFPGLEEKKVFFSSEFFYSVAELADACAFPFLPCVYKVFRLLTCDETMTACAVPVTVQIAKFGI